MKASNSPGALGFDKRSVDQVLALLPLDCQAASLFVTITSYLEFRFDSTTCVLYPERIEITVYGSPFSKFIRSGSLRTKLLPCEAKLDIQS